MLLKCGDAHTTLSQIKTHYPGLCDSRQIRNSKIKSVEAQCSMVLICLRNYKGKHSSKCISTYTHIHTYISIYISTLCGDTCLCVYACVYTHTYMCVGIYMCVCVYIYIYTYSHLFQCFPLKLRKIYKNIKYILYK